MISASFPGTTWCSSFWLNSAKIWYSVSTKVMTSLNGMPATKKPGRSITFTIVPSAGATHGRLFQIPAGVLELGARRLDLRLRDPHLRLRRGDLRLGPRHRREVTLDAAGELFPDLLLGGARRGDLRGELVDVGLRLLQIEAVAGAGGGELGVLGDALPGEFERGLQRGDLVRRLVELFVQLALARLARRAGASATR